MNDSRLPISTVLSRERLLFVVVLLFVFTGNVSGQDVGVDLFHWPGGEPFVKAIVTRDGTYPGDVDSDLTEMELRLRGILAVVTGRNLAALTRSCPRIKETVARPADAVVLYYLHLVTASGSKRTIGILQTPGGGLMGEESVGALTVIPMRAPINAVRFTNISNQWPRYRGSFHLPVDSGDGESVGDASDVTGKVFLLDQPYVCGRPYMDDRTIRNRGFVAERNQEVGTTRILANETIRVRLPVDYDAKKPAGLVVWVNAGPNGDPPDSFDEALDSQYFICAGADDSGNERPVADRYQLALDAVATVSARYHVDRRRVYVTGISGGGRISSMLYGAVPDVFTGTIAIVGLNFYKAVPTGDGRLWPATYRKPSGRYFGLMRRHRICAMTGPPDFNYQPIVGTIKAMLQAHLDAKLFSYDDMGHELPTADRFAEALAWVDGPYRKVRGKEVASATKLLERYHRQVGDSVEINDVRRKFLRKIMEAGPWSEASWEAWELLKR